MGNGFEEQVYDAACMATGEAVWQLVSTSKNVTPETIANMILKLSERRDELAISMALAVLLHA